MSTIGGLVGRVKNQLAFKPSDVWVCPDTCIGLEFEFERVARIPEVIRQSMYWEDKEDHSLHDMGREFVFREPLFGVDAENALNELISVAEREKWRSSLRCGIHVHMDVRDLSPAQLAGLLGYYCLFEPALYRWLGNDREFNNFCLPFYRANGSLKQAVSVVNTLYRPGNQAQTIRAVSEYHRYSGLNLKSIAELGSIEFRHMQTTTDLRAIKTWINLIFSLKKAALQVPASHRYAVLGDAQTVRPEVLLSRVFPDFVQELSYPEFAQEFLSVGFPTAYELMAGIDADNYDVETPVEYTDWEEPPIKDSDTHKGYNLWIRNHFPKDEKPTLEKPPPQEQDDARYEPYDEELLRRTHGVAVNEVFNEAIPPDRFFVIVGGGGGAVGMETTTNVFRNYGAITTGEAE